MGIFVRDKKFYQLLAATAVPVALQQLVTAGVNMTDNVMLGTLGEIQMSGATLANNFIAFFHTCCMGLGMGASVLTSRYWGMKAGESLKKSVILMYRLVFFIAVSFSVLTFAFPREIMRIYTSEPAVIEAGIDYFEISVVSYLLLGFSLTTSLILRSVGRANIPLISSVLAFFVNIFANWVFIFGNLGAPRMEIRGAALGTLIARVFEFLFIAVYLFCFDKNIGLRLENFRMQCRDIWPEYIKISLPVLVSDALLGVGNSAVAVVMGHIGAVFVAANAIITVVQQMSTVVIQGMSQAGCVITGNTMGQGKTHTAREQAVTMTALAAVIGCMGCGVILLLCDTVIDFYHVSEETKLLAKELMYMLAVTVIFQCVNSVLTKGVLRGGGDTKFLMVADILFLWCVSIPLGALAGLEWHLSGCLIYFFLRLDQILKTFWCLYRLKTGKWMKNIRPSEEKAFGARSL